MQIICSSWWIGSSYTVHGDILVYPGDEEKMFVKGSGKAKEKKPSKGNADKRDVTAFEYRLWPDGVLLYKIRRSTIGNFNIFRFSLCISLYQFVSVWLNLTSLKFQQCRQLFYFPAKDNPCKIFQKYTK